LHWEKNWGFSKWNACRYRYGHDVKSGFRSDSKVYRLPVADLDYCSGKFHSSKEQENKYRALGILLANKKGAHEKHNTRIQCIARPCTYMHACIQCRRKKDRSRSQPAERASVNNTSRLHKIQILQSKIHFAIIKHNRDHWMQ
jgi:hypothetical protein